MAEKGDLRVWWVPQVGSNVPPFIVPVVSLHEASLMITTLAQYDIYQLENSIKPDFSNLGGLEVYNGQDWDTWVSKEGDEIEDMDDAQIAAADAAKKQSGTT